MTALEAPAGRARGGRRAGHALRARRLGGRSPATSQPARRRPEAREAPAGCGHGRMRAMHRPDPATDRGPNRHYVLIRPGDGHRAQPATGRGKATNPGGRIHPGRGKNQPHGGCGQSLRMRPRTTERGPDAAEHGSSTTPHVADMHRGQPLHLVFSGLTGTLTRRSLRRSLDRRRPASVRPPRRVAQVQGPRLPRVPHRNQGPRRDRTQGDRSQLPAAPRSGRPTAP